MERYRTTPGRPPESTRERSALSGPARSPRSLRCLPRRSDTRTAPPGTPRPALRLPKFAEGPGRRQRGQRRREGVGGAAPQHRPPPRSAPPARGLGTPRSPPPPAKQTLGTTHLRGAEPRGAPGCGGRGEPGVARSLRRLQRAGPAARLLLLFLPLPTTFTSPASNPAAAGRAAPQLSAGLQSLRQRPALPAPRGELGHGAQPSSRLSRQGPGRVLLWGGP